MADNLEVSKNKKSRKKKVLVVAELVLFAIILGVGVFVIVYGAKPELFRDKNLVPTKATVISIEMKLVHDGTMPYPVYRYEFDGKEYTVESEVSVSPSPFDVGDEITIYVDPMQPKNIVTPIADKFWVIFGTVVALIAFFAINMLLYNTLSDIFPKSDLPKYIFRNVGILVFVWSGAIIGFLKTSILTWIIAIFIGLFATFLTVIMLIEFIEDMRCR